MIERKPVWVLFHRFCQDTKRYKRGNIYLEIWPPYGNSGDGPSYFFYESKKDN